MIQKISSLLAAKEPRPDHALTYALIVLQVFLSGAALYFAFLSALIVGDCGENYSCRAVRNVALFLTPGAVLVALIFSIALCRWRLNELRRAWWVPVVSSVGVLAVLVLQLTLTTSVGIS